MEYKEFLEVVQKKRGKKNFKVKGSWGVHDALNYIRSHGWFNIGRPLKEGEFYRIIRNINKLLAGEFVKGNSIHFPHNMGVLEIRKWKRGVRINDKGRLINTYPIMWDKTMKLWYEDEEARKKKILVRDERDEVCKIYYNKFKAHYPNQIFYEFVPIKSVKKALMENLINGKLDTLW